MAALACAGLLALPPSSEWLATARARHADLIDRLRAQPEPPAPVLAPGTAYPGDEAAALQALDKACRDIAAHEGALIERLEPLRAPAPGIVERHLVVSGGERTMLRVLEAIETHAPAIRLPRYRLASGPSGRALRLEADVVMAWGPR